MHVVPPDDLTVRQLHDILKLRTDVFVVEQQCPYPEVDGLDLLPTTRHVWSTDDAGRLASYLRVLDVGAVHRIGRVVTADWARGQGCSGRLISAVLTRWPTADVVLSAQSHLAHFYARFGFSMAGPEFVEDGIPHVPMRRPAH